MEDFLVVATEIERRLQGDKFRDWINRTIGAMPHFDAELPQAINQLNAPVATTNYDDYAAEITHCGAIPWTDRPDIDQWLKQRDRRHIHLHGIWRRPDSIILGHNSYTRLTLDDRTQFIQKVLGTRRLLLIGCGAGLNDPNLGPLLGWLRDELSGGNRNDYLLCLESDQYTDGPFVRVPFGPNYSDLEGFLRGLAPLGAKHQKLIDSALAYQAITSASPDEPSYIGQANLLIEMLGNEIASHASSELYDALEDWDDGIGLSIGLVKAIVTNHSEADIDRLIRIGGRIPRGFQYINAKAHLLTAFCSICPHIKDAAALQQVRYIIDRWLNEDLDAPLKLQIEVARNSLPFPNI